MAVKFTGCVNNWECLLWEPDFDTLGPEAGPLRDPPVGVYFVVHLSCAIPVLLMGHIIGGVNISFTGQMGIFGE